eukprot:CAMPEP_0181219610 /NCGR_PEP_ID=MMETSP1096-20121128/28378_1 /TAXON_ID=156174 ORGANISM="Chrysochromulina ericina, Strain CCMP281" /NCGR_SAMPLE_ID=MMETSP1096 /ASSEMBLY_ACC=CAM_ASM_000453 /LENGTH=131 /DNA_ID=CAMNT_0023312023 /DNA_START=283 /DNA_END=675 /DNA_ORIENTATION=-
MPTQPSRRAARTARRVVARPSPHSQPQSLDNHSAHLKRARCPQAEAVDAHAADHPFALVGVRQMDEAALRCRVGRRPHQDMEAREACDSGIAPLFLDMVAKLRWRYVPSVYHGVGVHRGGPQTRPTCADAP